MNPSMNMRLIGLSIGLFCSFVAIAADVGSVDAVVPPRTLPIPQSVSPQMQAVISAARKRAAARAMSNPQTTSEWEKILSDPDWQSKQPNLIPPRPPLEKLRELFDVTVSPQVIDGIPCFVVIPRTIPATNRDRLLVHAHGGAHVMGGGEAATMEAILVAGATHIKTISVDYRMPPRFPYPAPVDDVMAVWRVLGKQYNPKNIGIFGTSSGGGLVLSIVQRAREEGLPLPGAVYVGTPWSDLTKSGDSLFANNGVEDTLSGYEGLLEAAAKAYANGRDLADPLVSPLYGSFDGFPPSLIVTGTRDLFLSNSVRVHRKLLEAERDASLIVMEGA